MSAFTSLRFTREKALEYIKSKLEEPHLSDKMVEDLMDVILAPQLYNCVITDFPDEYSKFD